MVKKAAVIYARVSSTNDRQDCKRQVDDLTTFAEREKIEIMKVFEEKISGAARKRPVLDDCLDYIDESGVDALLTSEISRLGRSVRMVINTISDLADKKVNVYIQNINLWTLGEDGTMNPMTTMIISVLSSFAEIERENIKYRLNSGRERAKARGVKMGRPKGSNKSKEDYLNEYPEVVRMLRKGYPMRLIANNCDASLSTVQKVKKLISDK